MFREKLSGRRFLDNPSFASQQAAQVSDWKPMKGLDLQRLLNKNGREAHITVCGSPAPIQH